MKKADFFVIFFAILLGIAGFFVNNSIKISGDTVVVLKNGELVCELSLYENQEFEIDENNTVLIKDGEVSMKNATCPDKLCVKTGKISDSSKKIICLPNKVEIKVTKKSDVDTVVR